MKSCLTNDTYSTMRLSGESLFAIAGPQPWRGDTGLSHDGARCGSCHPSGVRLPGGRATWGLHPRLLHATPPAFRTIHASGVSNHTRLRRSEPRPSPSLRTMLAFSDSNDGRLRRSEPCHASGGLNLPSAFRTTFETLAYKPNSLLDSSSKKSTSLKGS